MGTMVLVPIIFILCISHFALLLLSNVWYVVTTDTRNPIMLTGMSRRSNHNAKGRV